MHRAFWEDKSRIFGLHEIETSEVCGCGNLKCTAIGKHPRIKSWQKVPHWSEEQLDALEEAGAFESGYGVICEGFIIVDVDARNGGVASYTKLCEIVPEIMGAGFIVNTGSGGGSQHLYFKNPSCKALRTHHADFKGIDFKSSGFVVGAGSNHKSGRKYEVAVGDVFDIDDAPKGLLDLLEVKEIHRETISGRVYDFADHDIESMLKFIDCDCDYEKWVQIGMAVHHSTDGAGFELWDAWSSSGIKYKGTNELDSKWYSFGKSAAFVTIGTLIHYAEKAGWVRSVSFETSEFSETEYIEDERETDKFELDVSDIDIRRPPDFVGRVTEWINAQCNYKRENLAVAAALTAVSNAGGMRLYDEETNMHANLYTVCVAGSGTGKNAILSAVKKLAMAAGIEQALCGGIKSEQEIFRNLLRNQAVFYIIDEIGDILSKLVKAKQRGGASYLDAVIAILLTGYSSAGDIMLITGDLKKEVQDELKAELKALEKALERNETKNTLQAQDRIKNIIEQIESTDCGIKNPFMSMFGLTTPVSFDNLMDYEMSTNGFIARTLIFRENNNNPRYCNVSIESREVPPDIEAGLFKLYTGGYYDSESKRVEKKGKLKSIDTTKEARAMLDKIRDVYFWELSESHDEKTGLTAISRRASEMCEKVSLILALDSSIRTLEHVRYAYALVSKDIELKTNSALSNTSENSGDALFARLLSLLDKKQHMTIGVLKQRCRGYEKADIEKALVKLEKLGKTKCIEKTGGKGKKASHWFSM